jgi:tetratricopeptide (TPR) repeat protein
MSAAIEAAREALQRGQPPRALDLARQLLRLRPDDVDALEVAAMAASALGQAEDAERDFRRIIAIDPSARWARDDLARLLLDQGRMAEAERIVREAIAADPTHADAQAMMGMMLADRALLVEAGWHFERAIALAGRHPELLVHLGRSLLRRGRIDEARALAEEAARVAPGLLVAAILAADVAEQRGDRAEAARWLDGAEPIARREGTDVDLARATLLAGGPEWREALTLLDRTDSLPGAARLLRGRLRDRTGRAAEAWRDFIDGKAALARPHDPAAIDRGFARAFPPDLPQASIRRDTPQPIFILGSPRSGTTMTEQLLAAHSRIRAGGELPFVAEMRDLAETLTGAPFPSGITSLRLAERQHIPTLLRDHYLARAEAYGLTSPGADFFTDKMPLNEIWLPLIRLAFPQSPLVLVRRHPLDTLLSAMSHDMTHGFNAFYRPEDAANHLAAVGRLVARYRSTLDIVPHLFAYERFVADPAIETERLMAALGLTAEPAQAEFHTLDRHAPTPSYAQVREPLHSRSIGRWKPYRAMLAPYIPILAELIAEGGYDA